MENKDKKVELFLDSGAYSAFTQNVKIDIQDYIQFIKDNQSSIDLYANLDVIGDAEKTWHNHQIMTRAGLNPMPVFHYGEDDSWLKRYLAKGCNYIALGGLVGGSSDGLTLWLDRLFSTLLCDEKGFPKIKIHGFGLTSLKMMLRYPWYSVDSTSWVVTGRMGGIFIPRWGDGKWNYDENSWKVDVSNRSPNSRGNDNSEFGKTYKLGKNRDGKIGHIDSSTKVKRDLYLRYIDEKGYQLGKSSFVKVDQSHELDENEKWAEKKPTDKKALREMEIIEEVGISNRYQLRDEMNIIYFLDLEKTMPEWPWQFKHLRNEKDRGFKLG